MNFYFFDIRTLHILLLSYHLNHFETEKHVTRDLLSEWMIFISDRVKHSNAFIDDLNVVDSYVNCRINLEESRSVYVNNYPLFGS